MALRYFQNEFADYVKSSGVQQQQARWEDCVLSITHDILKKFPPQPENCDGGLYVGCAGVAYMFYKLCKMEQFASYRQELLQNALKYSDVAVANAQKARRGSVGSRDPPSSFLIGAGGVYMVASFIAFELGDEARSKEFQQLYSDLAKACTPVNFLHCGSDELFVGRSGYLLGALMLNEQFNQAVSNKDMFAVFTSIIKAGREYAIRRRVSCPLMYTYYDTEYIGAAHGISAILQVLLCFPSYIKADPRLQKDVKASVEFILNLQQSNGNFPAGLDEVGADKRAEKDELVHWCHGAPGVIYMLVKAYQTYQDSKYLQACIACGELIWQKGLLRKGPGICHGVAGGGYAHLLLYRLTSDTKYLYRAEKFAEFLYTQEFTSRARTPDSPYSLFEGWAGTACFLADLLEPKKAAFPFFDVFG